MRNRTALLLFTVSVAVFAVLLWLLHDVPFDAARLRR